MRRQISKFGCIGIAATVVYVGAVALLVHGGLHPLLANAIAFIPAFSVSYLGHRFWTFDNRTTLSHKESAARFWTLSITGFAVNETLFFLLLRYTTLSYLAVLFMVVIVVTPLTFLLSRSWAFASR